MAMFMRNWQAQIRKGYLELVILQLLSTHTELYGIQFLQTLESLGLETKEGTLYPLLNRLSKEGLLKPKWVPQEKGVPKKYYKLTTLGKKQLEEMAREFAMMNKNLHEIGNLQEKL